MSEPSKKPPLVVETDSGRHRLWVSEWYRIRPRTFEQYELFFEPEKVQCIFAEESYKSFLLRKDGRERAAREVGKSLVTRPSDALPDRDRTFTIETSAINRLVLQDSSFLFKPKFVIATAEKQYDFYHMSRSYDVPALAKNLDEFYEAIPVERTTRSILG